MRRLRPMLRLRIMTQSPNIEKFVSLDSLIFLPFLIKLQLKDLLLFPSNRFHDDVSWHLEKINEDDDEEVNLECTIPNLECS